jgi:hypothetical protein
MLIAKKPGGTFLQQGDHLLPRKFDHHRTDAVPSLLIIAVFRHAFQGAQGFSVFVPPFVKPHDATPVRQQSIGPGFQLHQLGPECNVSSHFPYILFVHTLEKKTKATSREFTEQFNKAHDFTFDENRQVANFFSEMKITRILRKFIAIQYFLDTPQILDHLTHDFILADEEELNEEQRGDKKK